MTKATTSSSNGRRRLFCCRLGLGFCVLDFAVGLQGSGFRVLGLGPGSEGGVSGVHYLENLYSCMMIVAVAIFLEME